MIDSGLLGGLITLKALQDLKVQNAETDRGSIFQDAFFPG